MGHRSALLEPTQLRHCPNGDRRWRELWERSSPGWRLSSGIADPDLGFPRRVCASRRIAIVHRRADGRRDEEIGPLMKSQDSFLSAEEIARENVA
jgi:hypothetical protein